MINVQELKMSIVEGVRIINATAHPINFGLYDGTVVTVPPSGFVVNALATEETVSREFCPNIVRTKFIKKEEDDATLKEIASFFPNAVIVGSVIAAQAYPEVVAMVALPGFERVSPQEKRMNPHKFTTFF